MTLLPVVAMLWGVAVTVLWLVIGWRAMRAHERIAAAVEDSPGLLQRDVRRDALHSPTHLNARSG